MSSNEMHTGVLKKYPYDKSLSIEELDKWFVSEGFTPDYGDELFEYNVPKNGIRCWETLSYMNNEELFYNSEKREFWCLHDHKEINECDGHMRYDEQPDGTIKFSTMFYNGGCGLGEVIDDILMKKPEY